MSAGLHVVDLPGELPDAFVSLPHKVLGDDPHWIDPSSATLRAQCSEKNPWFAHGRARGWLVPGRARLSCFIEPDRYLEGHRAGFVGHFCTVGDNEPEDLVFSAAYEWAKAQGIEVLYGPIDFSTHFDYRLLTATSGEPQLPFPGEPYNPGWFPQRFERQCFSVSHLYTSRYLAPQTVKAYRDAGLPKLAWASHEGYRFEPSTIARWRAHQHRIGPAVDEMFRHNFAYTPLAVDRFAVAGVELLLRRALIGCSPLVWGPEGDLAGFTLVFPHWGPLVCGPNGIPLDHVETDRHLSALTERGPLTLLVKTTGVAPDHQSGGLAHAMMSWILMTIDEAGLHPHQTVAATMAADNLSQRGFPGQTETLREYALYRRSITTA